MLSNKIQIISGTVGEIPTTDLYGLDTPHQYSEGRVCRHVGKNARECGTVLCIYNPGPQCFKHTPPRFSNADDRRHQKNLLRKQKREEVNK